MNRAKSVAFLSALCSPILANAVDHYQVGMHRFAIRDPPVQEFMSTPGPGTNVVGAPVFNPRYVVSHRSGSFLISNSACPTYL